MPAMCSVRWWCVAALVAALVVLPACATAPPYRVTGNTQIDLRKDQTGKCGIPTDPAPVGGKHRATITWKIVNHCGDSYEVKVDRFAVVNTDGSPGDVRRVVDPDPAETSVATSGRLSATVRDDAEFRHYKYRISIRRKGERDYDVARDPDIDIWPY